MKTITQVLPGLASTLRVYVIRTIGTIQGGSYPVKLAVLAVVDAVPSPWSVRARTKALAGGHAARFGAKAYALRMA
jgi:hypothetical protein